MWVVKLKANGDTAWTKCLGGLYPERAYSVQQTKDDGYIVAGYTNTYTDGDVSGNHGPFKMYSATTADFWVVKLKANTNGEIEWQKCLGGAGDDYASAVQQTTDGGYIVAGYTNSNDGDLTFGGSTYHSGQDMWIVKLKANTNGEIEWQKCLGGSGTDYATAIQQTSDGGYIVAGYTTSNDGDVSGNHGGVGDAWIVKLNGSGNIIWKKCYGGSAGSYVDSWNGPGLDIAYDIKQTKDGGYIVAGYSNSENGDLWLCYKKHYSEDYWIIKLDILGNISWQKYFGGSKQYDVARSVQLTRDGSYIVAGYSPSTDNNITNNHGSYDFWVVKMGKPPTQ
jgi:hypothetical protein